MPYDGPLTPTTIAPVRDPRPGTARQAPDGVLPSRADDVLPVEPMLLVYQERLETFRLIVAAVRRSLKALTRPAG